MSTTTPGPARTDNALAPARPPRWGVLLVNLGTPDDPSVPAVRRYLRQFLSDPRVLDVPAPLRWLIVNLVVLPRRPRSTAAAYRKVWTPEGSPLRFHGQALRDAVAAELAGTPVALGMRYGNPSVGLAVEALLGAGADGLVVLPLFPQHSMSAWQSAVEEVMRVANARRNLPPMRVVPPFYDHPAFIDAVVAVAAPLLAEGAFDHVLFSFHGLPERHVRRSDEQRSPGGGAAHCLATEGCCASIGDANRFCYRAQSFATARALAAGLGLAAGTWEVAFQSRLGRDPWIRPYTDERVVELARAGKRRLAVLCPSFVADCLETIEEIGIRAKEEFLVAGGQDLRLIPCLNSDPAWVHGVVDLLRATAPELAGRG